MKYVQFIPLVIEDYSSKAIQLPVHSHTYFELIYIHSGKGKHLLNGNVILYTKGDIFLINPLDEHVIQVEANTHLTVIKFTPGYITEHTSAHELLDQIVNLMGNQPAKAFKLILPPPFDKVFKSTLTNLALFRNAKSLSSSKFIFYQFLSLMEILLINQSGHALPDYPIGDPLLAYIHHHILDPKALQIKSIANQFNRSPGYFSAYFKKKYGQSFRDYTQQYRLQLIINRLKNSAYTIKQIAQEFGFHDKSHLYHFFKSMQVANPAHFRPLD